MTMNKFLAILCVASAALICSCSGQQSSNASNSDNAGTKVYTFKDSCQHLVVNLSLELPAGDDDASALMREALIADFMLNARQPGYDQENEFSIQPYTGDMTDAQAIVDYFGKADYEFLLAHSMADYNERMQYLNEDTTMSAEYREQAKNDVPMWAFELVVKKASDNPAFAVYQSQTYSYFGGAHGGVGGTGDLTFDNSTGKKIERFVKADATSALQPLFRKGLLRYFANGYADITDSDLDGLLQLSEDNTIPQPVNTPSINATADSLVFVYRQYEIASYAAGMPNFSISVKDLEPFLTEEAKALLEKVNANK